MVNQSGYFIEFFIITFFFFFSCPSPWTGVECANRSSSDEFTCKDFCKNGGLCLNGKTGPFCHCKSNWKGTHCTIQSSCRYYCFHGGTCQEPVDELSSPTCMWVISSVQLETKIFLIIGGFYLYERSLFIISLIGLLSESVLFLPAIQKNCLKSEFFWVFERIVCSFQVYINLMRNSHHKHIQQQNKQCKPINRNVITALPCSWVWICRIFKIFSHQVNLKWT